MKVTENGRLHSMFQLQIQEDVSLQGPDPNNFAHWGAQVDPHGDYVMDIVLRANFTWPSEGIEIFAADGIDSTISYCDFHCQFKKSDSVWLICAVPGRYLFSS
jgi:hypothetical protein